MPSGLPEARPHACHAAGGAGGTLRDLGRRRLVPGSPCPARPLQASAARLSSRGFHNNNIRAIPERAFVGNPLLQAL